MRIQSVSAQNSSQNDSKGQKKILANEGLSGPLQGQSVFKQNGSYLFENRYKQTPVYGSAPQPFDIPQNPFSIVIPQTQQFSQPYISGSTNILQSAATNNLIIFPMNCQGKANQGNIFSKNLSNDANNNYVIGSRRTLRESSQFLSFQINSAKKDKLQHLIPSVNFKNKQLLAQKQQQYLQNWQISQKIQQQQQQQQFSSQQSHQNSPPKMQNYNDFDVFDQYESFSSQNIMFTPKKDNYQTEFSSPQILMKTKKFLDDPQDSYSQNSLIKKPFLSPQKQRNTEQLSEQSQDVNTFNIKFARRSSSTAKKKVNSTINENQALMIWKVKEKCIFKKYNDPSQIKKDSQIEGSPSYDSKMKFQSPLKKEKNLPIISSRDFIEGEGGDDSDLSCNENDQSIDFDDEDDTVTKLVEQASPQKKGSKVLLLKSIYPERPATIFFPYHKSCQQPKQRDMTRTVPCSDFEVNKFELKYKINGDNPYKCVVKAFEEAGFEVTDEDDWNVMWSLPKKDKAKSMNFFQKYNHFPGCWNLGRKDCLWKCLNKLRRKFPREMDFVPNTYLLANQGDWDRFVTKREEASKHQLWIYKPSDQACGRGVKVINKASKIKRKSNRIICDYISNPHLINGFKYDLRLYVLVTSYDPLRIYLFEDGLTRFATEAYTTSTKEVTKRYIHLTNYSVNKHAKKFVKNTNSDVDGEGSKWSLIALKKKYESMGIDVNKLFERIKDVIIKTCISTESLMLDITTKQHQHRQNCFELYGFDVLIDKKLKPWILEVNVCPSLSSSSPLDRKIKHSLLVDTLNIIGLSPYDKKQYDCDKRVNGIDSGIKKNSGLIEIKKVNQLEKQKNNNSSTDTFQTNPSQFNQIVDPINSPNPGNSKKSRSQFQRAQTMIDAYDLIKFSGQAKKSFSKNLNDIQDLCADNCLDKLSPENWEILFETDEENHRRGHFERIFPPQSAEKREYYSQFFEFQRFNNIIVDKWMSSSQNFLEKIIKKKYRNNV